MAKVTVTKTPPAEPEIEKVTLELTLEEAEAVQAVLGRHNSYWGPSTIEVYRALTAELGDPYANKGARP